MKLFFGCKPRNPIFLTLEQLGFLTDPRKVHCPFQDNGQQFQCYLRSGCGLYSGGLGEEDSSKPGQRV